MKSKCFIRKKRKKTYFLTFFRERESSQKNIEKNLNFKKKNKVCKFGIHNDS